MVVALVHSQPPLKYASIMTKLFSDIFGLYFPKLNCPDNANYTLSNYVTTMPFAPSMPQPSPNFVSTLPQLQCLNHIPHLCLGKSSIYQRLVINSDNNCFLNNFIIIESISPNIDMNSRKENDNQLD